MHQPKKLEKLLPLVEFAYNNGYQESLKMNLFEALYERSYNTPISLTGQVSKVLIGLDMLKEMEYQIHIIRKNLKVAQDRKIGYSDQLYRVHKEFQVGDMFT